MKKFVKMNQAVTFAVIILIVLVIIWLLSCKGPKRDCHRRPPYDDAQSEKSLSSASSKRYSYYDYPMSDDGYRTKSRSSFSTKSSQPLSKKSSDTSSKSSTKPSPKPSDSSSTKSSETYKKPRNFMTDSISNDDSTYTISGGRNPRRSYGQSDDSTTINSSSSSHGAHEN